MVGSWLLSRLWVGVGVMAVAKAACGWQGYGLCEGCRWVAAGSWLLPRLRDPKRMYLQ